jgi:Glycogen debranching enzyme
VQHFRSLGWDNRVLHDASPFRVVDPAINAILVRSEEDIAHLARRFGETELAAEAEARAARARAAFDSLWSPDLGQYLPFDRVAGQLVTSPSVGGLLPLLAGLGDEGKRIAMRDRIRTLRSRVRRGVPTHDPADPRFEAKRYWRGPCWLIINYLLADGLDRCGFPEDAAAVRADSLALVENGFAEYYDPLTGEGLGGGNFTWTAAIVIETLATSAAA